MAPITPHITEEIYSLYFKKKERVESIHINEWPKPLKITADEKPGNIAVEIISAVRKFKAQNQLSLKAEISKLTVEYKDEKSLKPFLEDIKASTHAEEIVFGKADNEITPELKINFELKNQKN